MGRTLPASIDLRPSHRRSAAVVPFPVLPRVRDLTQAPVERWAELVLGPGAAWERAFFVVRTDGRRVELMARADAVAIAVHEPAGYLWLYRPNGLHPSGVRERHGAGRRGSDKTPLAESTAQRLWRRVAADVPEAVWRRVDLITSSTPPARPTKPRAARRASTRSRATR